MPKRTNKYLPEPGAFDIEQAAQYCNVGLNTMKELLRQGKIKCFHVNRRVVIPKVRLDEWMQENSELGNVVEI